ncbi:hypothetical protein TWF694_008294 [Orbilia ellipsospora]|uniref:T6SS Phospholipase effector Tle1-like catalytic domain-containing protein n=1 Tax=Orbilia ellipsospora TaxID=2528407 RepID=A0AAV9XFN5_9PEZI
MPYPPSQAPEPAPKRIIICCDGTWQSAVSGNKNSPSNATRLARCLERACKDAKDDSKVWQQIVWYDSGVGTTSSAVGKMVEGLVGAGVEGNIIEAYNFAVLNYNSGDQILIFGFSRGAYTARAIAGLISDIGICEPRNLHHFPEIWELYKSNKAGERFYGSDAYWDWVDGKMADEQPEYDPTAYKAARNIKWDIHPHGDWASDQESRNIEVVGVYDTVGALGFPKIQGYNVWPFGPDKSGFYNVRLNRNIKRAFHALAIDEHRESFTPTLWWIPAEQKKPSDEDINQQEEKINNAQTAWYSVNGKKDATPKEKLEAKAQLNEERRKLIEMHENLKEPSELLQVWFPGVHISVGGGSKATVSDKGDLEEISNVTFCWMLDHIAPYIGIKNTTIYQESTERSIHISELNEAVKKYKELLENEEAKAKASWKGWIASKASQVRSAILRPFVDLHEPDVNRQDRGWATGAFIESCTTMYKAIGSKPRTPGQYEKDDTIPVKGITNEQIHPTVGYRIEVTKDSSIIEKRYKPLGEGAVIRQEASGGGWEYVLTNNEKKAKVVLPEYKIKPRSQLFDGLSFERMAAAEGSYENNEKASEYISRLDEGNGYPAEDKFAVSANVEEDMPDQEV